MSNVEHLEASMRSFRSVTLALVFAAGPTSMAAAQPPTPQPLHYWHVWVDSAGMTHQTQCEFKDFTVLGNPRLAEVRSRGHETMKAEADRRHRRLL
jgi:hypothetical protein